MSQSHKPIVAHAAIFAALLGAVSLPSTVRAEIVITPRVGCPMFHCTPGSTGVMAQPLVATLTRVVNNNSLGTLKAQGCSGNGNVLACLYMMDTAADPNMQGTLKLLNAATLEPIWGSGAPGLTNPYDISMKRKSYSIGEVPYILPNGLIIAGDGNNEALYDGATGNLAVNAVANPLVPLNSQYGDNFGITQLVNGLGISAEDNDYAVVSQSKGGFTLVKLSTWSKMGASLAITGLNNETVSLASPSSAGGSALYAVAANSTSGNGYLFTARMDTANKMLVNGPVFNYRGASGCSPVIVRPDVTGDSAGRNMILLHVPQLAGDVAQDRLVSLWDNGDSLTLNTDWPGDGTPAAKPGTIALGDALGVAPTIDEKNKIIYFQFTGNGATTIYAYSLLTGQPIATYPIQNVFAKAPNGFKLNGHLVSVQANNSFTLLTSAAVPRASNGVAAGEYAIAYQPATRQALWVQQTAATPDSYTAAWSIGAPDSNGNYCPTVVGTGLNSPGSGITLLCNH